VSIQFDLPITQPALAAVARIDGLRGDWVGQAGLPADRLERLAEAATIQSIGASCRLSGIRVADREVAEILRGHGAPLSDLRAVNGYMAAIGLDLGEGRVIDARTLQRLNAVVLGGVPGAEGADAAEQAPTGWRTQPAHCEVFDAQGHATGRVIPILPPRLIEEKLDHLLSWFALEIHDSSRHPLPAIAAFVLGLMAISPFENGNGRTIRALTRHLLRRAGYHGVRYASLEAAMEDSRETYYDAFDRSQSGIWSGEADFSPWLGYFLTILDRHRERVEVKFALERGNVDLSPLQRTILDAVREHGSVDAGLLLRATGANRNTLKDNVRRLVSRGVLEKMGDRRTTRYRLASSDRPRSAAGAEIE
jgi:Fic family protein